MEIVEAVDVEDEEDTTKETDRRISTESLREEGRTMTIVAVDQEDDREIQEVQSHREDVVGEVRGERGVGSTELFSIVPGLIKIDR